jgi:hypothetical protein
VTGPTDSTTRRDSWSEFMESPAAYIDGGRLDACFGNEFGAGLCDRLRTSIRLRERISAVVRAHYVLVPWLPQDDCSDIDREIALSPAAHLIEIAQRSGAVFWAGTIANVILARQVEALRRQLGDALYGYALAHRDLSGPAQALEPLDTIGSRVAQDGWRCFGAWCHVLPAGICARVRLKLAANVNLEQEPEGPFREFGPPIVRRAAG